MFVIDKFDNLTVKLVNLWLRKMSYIVHTSPKISILNYAYALSSAQSSVKIDTFQRTRADVSNAYVVMNTPSAVVENLCATYLRVANKHKLFILQHFRDLQSPLSGEKQVRTLRSSRKQEHLVERDHLAKAL